MNARSKHPAVSDSERGAVLVLVAISIVVLLGFAALVVDLGYLFVARNQLQNVADGAALAATRTLGHIYQGLAPEDQQGFDCLADCQTAVRQAAYDVAGENWAAGIAMTLREQDVTIGHWDGDTFTPTLHVPDAVEVVARRDSEVNGNGPVTTFFARVLGSDEADVNAIATAAMTGQGTTTLGEVELPVGISEDFFEGGPDEYCKEDIVLHPTTGSESCAGWTIWNYGNSEGGNTNTLVSILDEDEGYDGPVTIAGSTTYKFTGGDAANAFSNLLVLFQKHGFATDNTDARNYILDPVTEEMLDWQDAVEMGESNPNLVYPWYEDGVQAHYPDWDNHAHEGALRFYHKWETTLPVYRGPCGANPSGSILIVGFAKAVLTDVMDSPEKKIVAHVECNLVSPEDNRGGGGTFGIRGPIPSLVR